MDYTTLSLSDVRRELEAVGSHVKATFGPLDGRQLNWRPDATSWSVAQCCEHMLTVNGLVLTRMSEAFDGSVPKSFWQRLPVLPGLIGRMIVRSQAPSNVRKFKAPARAQPTSSDIDATIVARFADQVLAASLRARSQDEPAASQAIMTSPFLKPVVFSVLDGWRLMVAHTHRHVEQARHVTQSAGFPRSG